MNEPRSAQSPRVRVQLVSGTESRTKQSETDACDIRKIMAKYRQSGVQPVHRIGEPVYGDFTTTVQLQEGLQSHINAQRSFLALPSAFRKELKHDPANLVDWLQDERNRDRANEMGILAPDAKPPQPSPPDPGGDAASEPE